jgi:hypothetical protein
MPMNMETEAWKTAHQLVADYGFDLAVLTGAIAAELTQTGNDTARHARVKEPYYLLPLRDAAEVNALLDLLMIIQSEVLRPVLHRLLQYAKEVRDADSR